MKVISLILTILIFFSENLIFGMDFYLFPTKSSINSNHSSIYNPSDYPVNAQSRVEFNMSPSKFGIRRLAEADASIYIPLSSSSQLGSSLAGKHFDEYSNLNYSIALANHIDSNIIFLVAGNIDYKRYEGIESANRANIHISTLANVFNNVRIAASLVNLVDQSKENPSQYIIGVGTSINKVSLDYSISLSSNKKFSNNFSLLFIPNKKLSICAEFYSLYSQVAILASIALNNDTRLKITAANHLRLGWTISFGAVLAL